MGAGGQEHGAVGRQSDLLKAVDQLAKDLVLVVAGPGLGRDQAVEHQEARPPTQDLASQQVEDRLEPMLAHLVEGAEVGEALGQGALVEERHPMHVADHARVVLCQERDEQRLAAARHVVETDLVGEDRLAGPRRALDDVHAAKHEPAPEDGIEPGDAARDAILRQW